MSREKISIKGPQLHNGQMRIFKGVTQSSAMFHTVCTPRGFGKSFLGGQLILYYAINNPHWKIIFTSPTYKQCALVSKELFKGIKHLDILSKHNKGSGSMEFKNGSSVEFLSMKQPDNIRGYHVEVVICDEAAMYPEDVFEKVIRSFIRVKGKKVILLSTPRGKNWFFRYYNYGISYPKKYRSYKGTSIENPRFDKEEYETAKRDLNESIFKQEYQGEFVDDYASVFSNYRQAAVIDKWTEPVYGDTYYAGIDLGRESDFTVLTIMNQRGEIVYIYRMNQVPWDIIINEIGRLLNKYKPRHSFIEINSHSKVVEDVQKKFNKIESWWTSNESKQQIIQDLIFSFERGELTLPSEKLCNPLLFELDDFTFTFTKNRRYQYHAKLGHDDCVISLGLANHARLTGSTKGQYCVEVVNY